jgi:hypothetical protein
MLSFVLVAGFVTPAAAQPGDRTAIVHGARLVGETEWQFGSFSVQTSINAPVTVEVGMFFYRSQGVGMRSAVFKTYVDTLSTNSIELVEDPSNGVPPTGTDGRVGAFNFGFQVQRVFTNRHASIPGSGFRIATGTGGPQGNGDITDGSTAGGISGVQRAPADAHGSPNPDFVTADGVLEYRFNVVAVPLSAMSQQTIHIFTPLSRVQTYSVYDNMDGASGTSLLPILQTDPIDLNITWVPAPSAAAALVLAGAAGLRLRRPSCTG